MEDFNESVNSAEVAEPQIEEVQDTGVNESEVAEPKPVQDTQTNAAFAEMRRKAEEAEARARQVEEDYEYARQYSQYGIYSKADYDRAIAEQEAQNAGMSADMYSKFMAMEQKLNSIEREKQIIEQDRVLESDPHKGELYKSWKGEVKSLADQFGTDLTTAFTFLLDKKLPEILSKTQTQAEQTAIKKITQNATSSPGALGQGGENVTPSIKNMSKSDFERLKESALRGEIRKI